MNILITNFHSIANKGDLGIVEGLMSGLRTVFPEATFTVVGRDREEQAWWETQGVELVMPLLLPLRSCPAGRFHRIRSRASAIRFIIRFFISMVCLYLPILRTLYFCTEDERTTLRAYERADLVISKGGSFFREPEYRRNILPVGILGHLHQLAVGFVLNKRVVLSGQSFGPINNPVSRYLIRRIFRRCALITTRESDSYRYLRDVLKVRTNVVSAGDTAFLLEAPSVLPSNAIVGTIDNLRNEGRLFVGITVRSWSHHEQFERYLNAVVETITTGVRDNYSYFFMPQVIGPSQVEDDRTVARSIRERVPEEHRVHVYVIEDDISPSQLLALYAKMDYYIATRLHSSIFALLAGVPVIAIGYEPKTVGIFSDIGLSDHVVDIRTVTAADLRAGMDRLSHESLSAFRSARDTAVRKARETILAIRNITI